MLTLFIRHPCSVSRRVRKLAMFDYLEHTLRHFGSWCTIFHAGFDWAVWCVALKIRRSVTASTRFVICTILLLTFQGGSYFPAQTGITWISFYHFEGQVALRRTSSVLVHFLNIVCIFFWPLHFHFLGSRCMYFHWLFRDVLCWTDVNFLSIKASFIWRTCQVEDKNV